MHESIPNDGEELVSSQHPEGYVPDSEEILYTDPRTGLVHKFSSTMEKAEFIEDQNKPENKN
ncbi:MAG: hypothetical protein V4465_02850 [Patescibacteria group bacterium]